MTHPVKPYYLPIRINKCLKCLRHDHTTKSCSHPRLCPKCAEAHSLENGCPNQERCINCGGDHFSGHSACPVVQEKRRIIVEQSKRQRAELLVLAEKQQHQFTYRQHDFPILHSPMQTNSFSQIANQADNAPQRSYVQVVKQRNNQNTHRNIEHTFLAFLNKMENRLNDFSSRLSSQICGIEKKINAWSDRQREL